jgi:hypothetical protein
MKRLGLIIVACVVLSAPALALTDEECANMWKSADANGDGMVTGAELDRYAVSLRVANKTVPDRLDQAMFFDSCKAGVFTTANADDGAPLAGANSFTENQARDRVAAAGFNSVSALAKDANGIWRGTATKDGANVKVAVDYKGNVVAN